MKKHHPNGHPHPAPSVTAYIHQYTNGRYGLVVWGGPRNGLKIALNLDTLVNHAVHVAGAHVVYID